MTNSFKALKSAARQLLAELILADDLFIFHNLISHFHHQNFPTV
jgi:hypothetical protein